MRSGTYGSYDPWASRVISSVLLGPVFSLSFVSLLNFVWLSLLSFARWVPLFHDYFSVHSFCLLKIYSLWGFQGRSYNYSLRFIVDFLRPLQNGHLWPKILPTPWFFLLLSCFVAIFLLITIGLPVLLLVNHPNPLPRMYKSPHHCFLFTPILYPPVPTLCHSVPLAAIPNGLCLSWTTPNVGLRPMSHRFRFDGTLTTLLCSIQHFFCIRYAK